MCTLNKQVKNQATSYRVKTLARPVATPETALPKPITCTKCRTIHYAHQIACKRCGEYFKDSHADASGAGFPSSPSIVAAAATIIGVVGALVLHMF